LLLSLSFGVDDGLETVGEDVGSGHILWIIKNKYLMLIFYLTKTFLSFYLPFLIFSLAPFGIKLQCDH
jgi:hypothetical protein